MKSLIQFLKETTVAGDVCVPNTPRKKPLRRRGKFNKKRTVSERFLVEMKSQIVYSDPITKQYVALTAHAKNDRTYRPWWDSFQDESFTRYVQKILRRLDSLYRQKIKNRDSKIDFAYAEEFGVISKDGKRGMVISLRDTGGNNFTSFSIVTVLNADAKDSASKEKVFLRRLDDEHTITLTEGIEQKTVPVLMFID